VIRSSEEARAAARHRKRQIGKAEDDLKRVQKGILRYYKTEAHVTQKVNEILRDRRVAHLYKWEVGTQGGRPYLEWRRDDQAVEKEEKLSGCYTLLSTLPADRTANDVLTIQKDQVRVERRFSDWKGPLAVHPIHLHNNRRIAALVLVQALALMIFSLIERQVRQTIGDKDGYAVGFLPEGRKSRPTGGKILHALRNVEAIVVVEDGKKRIERVCKVSPLAKRIHEAFGVEIDEITRA
jgi:transposase